MSDFMEEFGNIISEAADKLKEYGEYAKIQGLIKAEEAKKQEYYYKLGKKYYELYKDAPASDLSTYMIKLLTADEKIEGYKEELKTVAAAHKEGAEDAKECEACEEEKPQEETARAAFEEDVEAKAQECENEQDSSEDAVADKTDDLKKAYESVRDEVKSACEGAAEKAKNAYSEVKDKVKAADVYGTVRTTVSNVASTVADKLKYDPEKKAPSENDVVEDADFVQVDEEQ